MNQDIDKLKELLQAADCVPDAPDCRRAVMERIASPAPRFRLVWAYAAVVVLVGLALGSLLYLATSQPGEKPEIVKIVTPTPKKAPMDKQAAIFSQSEKPKLALKHAPRDPEPVKVVLLRPKRGFRHAGRIQRVAVRKPVDKLIPPAPEPAPRFDENAPVALVIVSGPTSEQSDGYGYKEVDPDTGKVTTCNVRRSGNEVYIYLESTPGKDVPPVKGSLDYENPNA